MIRRSQRLRRASATLVVAAFVATGCHTAEGTIDGSSLQDQVGSFVAGLGSAVSSVSCPSSIPARKGHEFTCTVTSPAGLKSLVRVTETDDRGNVSVRFLG
jgi:hypothetical protein